MATELRIYTINKGALDQWVKEWRDMIKPLREKLGFEILDAWTIEKTNQFVWVLKYDGPEPWEKLDRTFHDSEERRSFDPDPARNLARAEHFFLEPVD